MFVHSRPSPSDLASTAGHDDGLSHHHHWARETAPSRGSHPVVADAARMSTPSSVFHDDVHYA